MYKYFLFILSLCFLSASCKKKESAPNISDKLIGVWRYQYEITDSNNNNIADENIRYITDTSTISITKNTTSSYRIFIKGTGYSFNDEWEFINNGTQIKATWHDPGPDSGSIHYIDVDSLTSTRMRLKFTSQGQPIVWAGYGKQ